MLARTSPTLHPPSPPTVHQLSQLALLRVNKPRCACVLLQQQEKDRVEKKRPAPPAEEAEPAVMEPQAKKPRIAHVRPEPRPAQQAPIRRAHVDKPSNASVKGKNSQ